LRRLSLSLPVLLLFNLLSSAHLLAHFDTNAYIYRQSRESSDPVNIIFYADATFSGSKEHIRHHLGWNVPILSDVVGDVALFYDHGQFNNQDEQLSDPLVGGTFDSSKAWMMTTTGVRILRHRYMKR
jgi:hypothetical protein